MGQEGKKPALHGATGGFGEGCQLRGASYVVAIAPFAAMRICVDARDKIVESAASEEFLLMKDRYSGTLSRDNLLEESGGAGRARVELPFPIPYHDAGQNGRPMLDTRFLSLHRLT